MARMIQTLKRLIAAKSTLEVGELAAAQAAAEEARKRGIDSDVDGWGNGRANVIGRIRSTGENPGILFLAHIDVVDAEAKAWRTPPFEAVEQGGRVYGRGAVDMKGGTAAILEAMGRIIAGGAQLKGDVHFAGVGGEETDSAGIERFVSQVKQLGPLAGIVICEPTAMDIVTAHRGMVWVRITTLGKSAHGSMPHIGVNAVESMLNVLEKVRKMDPGPVKHPRLGSGTISINRIQGGFATNIIPDSCSAEVDVRIVPGQTTEATFDRFKRLVGEMQTEGSSFRAKLDVLKKAEALETSDSCDFVKGLCRATGVGETRSVGFTTDGPWLVPLGVPIVILGPGDPELCHKPDEYIEVSEMEKAVIQYQAIMEQLLA
jgi:succinyl-diaminopimelate desuccinylase